MRGVGSETAKSKEKAHFSSEVGRGGGGVGGGGGDSSEVGMIGEGRGGWGGERDTYGGSFVHHLAPPQLQ